MFVGTLLLFQRFYMISKLRARAYVCILRFSVTHRLVFYLNFELFV